MTSIPARSASYGWIITADHLDPSRHVGIVGPHDISPDVHRRLQAGDGRTFTMYDSDGERYYTGRYIGPEHLEMAPLDDFGTPDSGATDIHYHQTESRMNKYTRRVREDADPEAQIGLVGDPEGLLSYGADRQCAECGSVMTPQGDDFVCTNCGNEQISGADERIANPDNTTTSDLPPDADLPDANAGDVTPAIPEGRFIARKHSLVAKHEGVIWSKHSFDPKGASAMLKKTPVTAESLRALGFVPTRRS